MPESTWRENFNLFLKMRQQYKMDISTTTQMWPVEIILDLPPPSPKSAIEVITLDSPPQQANTSRIINYTDSLKLTIFYNLPRQQINI